MTPRRRTPGEVSSSRIDQAAARPHPTVVGARLDDNAILSDPKGQTEKQRQEEAKRLVVAEREAAMQVCDWAIREGCGGAPGGDDPGCLSASHGDHVASVVFLWQMTGLAEAGKIAAKFGEAS